MVWSLSPPSTSFSGTDCDSQWDCKRQGGLGLDAAEGWAMVTYGRNKPSDMVIRLKSRQALA